MSWAGESEDYLQPHVSVPKNRDPRGQRASALSRTNSVDPRVNEDVISSGERINSFLEYPAERGTSHRAWGNLSRQKQKKNAPTGHFYNADSIEARDFFDANNEHIQRETGHSSTVQTSKDGYVGDFNRTGNFDEKRNQYHPSVHLHQDEQRAHVGVRSQGMEFGPYNQGTDFFARGNKAVLNSSAHQQKYPLDQRHTVGFQRGPSGSIPLHTVSNDPSSEQSHNNIINSTMQPTVLPAPLTTQDVAGILTESQREAYNKGSEYAFQGGKNKKRKSGKSKKKSRKPKRKSRKSRKSKPKRKSRKSRKPKRKSKKSNRKSRKSNKKSRKPKRKLFNK